MDNNNFSYNVTQQIGVISKWDNDEKNIHNSKEINMVSWGGRQPMIDIRNWFVDATDGKKKPGKGISFNINEAKQLLTFLNNILGNQ